MEAVTDFEIIVICAIIAFVVIGFSLLYFCIETSENIRQLYEQKKRKQENEFIDLLHTHSQSNSESFEAVKKLLREAANSRSMDE